MISAVLIAGLIAEMIGFSGQLLIGDLPVSGTNLFLCTLVGLAVTGLLVWITEYYTSTEYPPGAQRGPGIDHRPCDQHHPGSRRLDGILLPAGAGDLRRHHRGL